ncbi:hypothetical protein [Methylophilus sp.]|uniref:hypothetical protein n=1 Tax=Methylophilus sp. TaxID=29541 RepID=UPI0040369BBA
MTVANNNFSKFTPEELRFLLRHFDTLDHDLGSVKSDIAQKLNGFSMSQLPDTFWAPMYELSFIECLGLLTHTFGISDKLKEIGQIATAQGKISNIANLLINNLNEELEENPEDSRKFALGVMSFSYVLIASVQSLSTYGCYINDLVKVARESDSREIADSALIKAIKIDPSVAACPTTAKRLSFAVLCNDTSFIGRFKKALSGKLGVRESKSYQKMRFILQVLHEADALNLSDKELKQLFVNELKIYSDSQSTSEKNLAEFTRKFKAQKSTI